jgi:hypothetical protein
LLNIVYDSDALEKFSVWDGISFVSPFLTSEVFLHININLYLDEINLDETEINPYAQQIIYAGLRDMTEEDFKDSRYFRVLNAMYFRWGYNVSSVLRNVWVSPHV